jgi:lysophospholipase L1-like esterase
MAFGDSLTEGKPSRLRAFDDFAGSYPSVLYPLLTARYVAQTLTMSKQGKGGEFTVDGVTRLNTLLASERPEVLLLMEGSNDLSGGAPSAIAPALRNMEQMVVNAKASGAYVFLATIPPQVAGSSSGRGYQIVPTYNDEIRRIATAQNVVLVDIFGALNASLSANMGADGLHCTTAGYQKMADTFYAATQARLEIPGTTPTSGVFVPLGTVIVGEPAQARRPAAGLDTISSTPRSMRLPRR